MSFSQATSSCLQTLAVSTCGKVLKKSKGKTHADLHENNSDADFVDFTVISVMNT